MTTTVNDNDVALALPPKTSELRRVIRIFFGRKIAVVGFVIICLYVLIAIFAPFVAPHDPNFFDSTIRLQQPSSEHLLGTDSIGRDTLSRIIYGSRTTLLIGVSAVVIGSAVGQFLGLLAAYFGGWINIIIMRLMDVQISFPGMILMLLIGALLGGGTRNVIIALSISMIPVSCRLMCGEALSVKQNEYITAARAIGSSPFRIMLRRIYPNCFPSLLVMMSIMMGVVIISEAGLSYLGIGVQVPQADWGSMVSDGYRYLLTNPILALSPGIAIMLMVFGFNMMGDGLRDALDPKLRGII
ncbi:MAG: ABC transporter permease [Dehalococcoidales bacterium]|jgi:ABC-type dipeptide/oligopeptide/nickel transport system permease subunit